MAGRGTVKAGPVTLALGLMVSGLLLYNFDVISRPEQVWKLWLLLLIGLDVEYFAKRAMNKEAEVHLHAALIIVMILVGNVIARSSAGIVVAEPGGDVDARTAAGKIKLTSESPLQGKYRLESETGEIDFRMPRKSDLSIEAEADIGRVVVQGLEGTVRQGGPGQIFTAKLGDGTGSAELEVRGGTISVGTISVSIN